MGRNDTTVNKAGPAPFPPGIPPGPPIDSKSDVKSNDDNEQKKDESEIKRDISLKQNATAGLKAFGPTFWKHSRQFATPFARTKNHKGVRKQLNQIKRSVEEHYRTKQKRLDEANKSWKSYFRLLGTQRTLASMGRELTSLNDLKKAAEACEQPLETFEKAEKHLRALRQKLIPRDEAERNLFFADLKQAASDVKSAGKTLEKALSNLSGQVDKRKSRIFWSRSWWRPFRKPGRYDRINRILGRLNDIRRHMLATRDCYKNNIAEQMDAEIKRIAELKSRIDKAADGESGQDALDNVLGRADGDAQLRTSVALKALRCGEPLSPRLKHALTNEAIVGKPDDLGSGFFNKVYKAKLRFRAPDGKEIEGDYALKRLDARITFPNHVGTLLGLADRQVGVFARHCAANQISEAMGMDLVGKPELMEVKGRLFMALPLVEGYHLSDFKDAMEAAGGTRLYNILAEALHDNLEFQNLCKEIQLFQVLTSDPDSHSENVKFRFTDPVTERDVSPQQMAQMKPAEISKLRVKAGLFDQDMAFPPMGSIRREYQDPAFKYPKRWRYLGPPPFHTNADRERTENLLKNLESGQLGREMRWHLINDDSKDHDEFAALKTRTAALKKHMDEDKLHRLDATTGQYLNRLTSEPYGTKNMQRHLSDTAPKVMYGPGPPPRPERIMRTSASNVHKYMRLKKTG